MWASEYEIEAYEQTLQDIQSWKADRTFQDCQWHQLSIGDDVVCSFCPSSQRDIYSAVPTYGTVVEIGANDDSVTLEFDGKRFPMLIPGFHMFGMARCYTYYVSRCAKSTL